jgi:hypothetical protein
VDTRGCDETKRFGHAGDCGAWWATAGHFEGQCDVLSLGLWRFYQGMARLRVWRAIA